MLKIGPVKKKITIIIFAIFFCVYVGAQLCCGYLLTPFSVLSKLQLSKPTGAHVQATFWASFTFVRFLGVFAAMKLAPIVLMVFSLVLCLIGGIAMCFLAEYSLAVLQVGSVILGAGLATMYATGNPINK